MKYQPSIIEKLEVETYSESDRLHFFLTRAIESEEVWGLSNPSGWVMKEDNNRSILPIWPYEIFAANCASNQWQDYAPAAVSLEHFVYNLLPIITKQEIGVEIFPTTNQSGSLLEASKLAELFEGMLESGEYYMEG